MIDIKDRVPTYPGRVRLIPVAGQTNTYDMVRADEPVEPGTPINRALFQAFIDELNAVKQQIDDKLFEISHRVTIKSLDRGSEFGLYENGILVPFIKLSTGYKSTTEDCLVIRKNCIISDFLLNSGQTTYADSRADTWLSNEYFSMLDTVTQNVIPDALVEATSASFSGNTNIRRKIFLLSTFEYGFGSSGTGYNVSFFGSNASRIATLNGTPVNQWTREFYDNKGNGYYVSTSGELKYINATTTAAGLRPAFLLPPGYEVVTGIPSAENVMATAEV